MKRMKLKHAVALGLLLSTSICVPAFAADMTIAEFKEQADSGNNISVTTDTVVTGTGTSIGGDEMNNALTGYHVTVDDGVRLDLNDLAGNHMDIKGNGNVYITANKDAGANGAAVYMNGNIEADSLTINTENAPNTKGIYTYGGNVVIDVNALNIKSNSHGIFTTSDATSDVIIDDTQSINITTNGAHGIVNSGNSAHVNNVYLRSEKEGSSVNIFSHTAGISNNHSGGGVIDIQADTVQVVTDNLYAVRGDHGDIMLTAKNNIVTGGTSGIHAGNGNITVTATENNAIGIDDANSVYQNNYDSYNDGAVYGYKGGNIQIIAGNNNIVNSYKTGIHNKGTGNIILIAGNGTAANTAVMRDGELTESNIITAGTDGINVESSTVTLMAETGTNQITSGQNGVVVSGIGSVVTMKGKNNIIIANGETPIKDNVINGIYVTDGGKYVIDKNDGNNTIVDVTGNEANKFTYGINAEKSGIVDIDTNDFTLNTSFDGVFYGGSDVRGIYSEQSNIDIDAEGAVNVTVTNTNRDAEIANTTGVRAETKDTNSNTYGDTIADITAEGITINSTANGNTSSLATGVEAKSVVSLDAKATVNLTATKDNVVVNAQSSGTAYGVNAADTSEVNLTAHQGDVIISASGGNGSVSDGIIANSIDIASSEKDIASQVNIIGMNTDISGTYEGILAQYGKTYVVVDATQGNNLLRGGTIGVRSENGADVQVTASQGNNIVMALDENTGGSYGIYTTNTTGGSMTSPQFTNGKFAKVVLDGKNNSISNFNRGIYEYANSDVQLKAKENNSISAKNHGIYSSFTSTAALTAGQGNYISAGDTASGFGNAYAVYAFDNGTFTGTKVILSAGETNQLLGGVYASGIDTTVQIVGLTDENGNYGSSQYNYIGSSTAIANAGDLNTDSDFAGKEVISSLYAEDGAQISVTGNQNVIRTYADNTNENQLERTVWAYNTADISIDGQAYISTDRYETSPNSLDIAIAAGTATGLTEDVVLAPVADRATVTLNYDSYTDAAGNVVNSVITGDILSAYAGQVDITPKNDGARIDITGNLLAGNNGVLNVNLGNGGTLTGRADDYGDAGVINGSSHTTFFDPAFSSEIFKGGEVNLTMGDNSRWNVTGQSWITRINTEGSSNAIIDLVSANTDRNASAHALTIYEMNGDAVFNMSLDADRTLSDMVYMKNANGEYVVNVVDPVTQEDMYAGRSDGGIFDGLRFATVGKGSTASFRAITWDQGINNIEYEVGTDSYDTSQENHHYDSSTGNGSGDTEKPGSDLVEGFFDSEGTPGAPEANGIMTLAAESQQDVIGTDTGANGTTVDETTNYKLIGVKSTELSDAGKTVVSMSRINYSNAVYMDRLNKRMGEARYLDGDEGLWVRMRHDRIGKSDAFRSMNTMMELGYDRKVGDREDGEHRQGFALDYMRGTADYKNVAGEGDVRRAGVWFYDTWLGDKGHYTDYVLKFGRLSNDFEVYARSTGEKITGDYSNFVYSASAEYGRKKDLGNDWYIEPQAQIQYAHVTDADYTTSQGTNVQLDAIDSLIGRVGFRLGKDMGEKTTFYVKADILHEFLGDQDIEARDATGYLDTTYENEGTWYDVGLGFSHQFSKGTYMFLDMEKTFGNDNEDTYQFNVGMNWKV